MKTIPEFHHTLLDQQSRAMLMEFLKTAETPMLRIFLNLSPYADEYECRLALNDVSRPRKAEPVYILLPEQK